MDARRRSDEMLDEISRLLKQHRNWVDYLTTMLTVLGAQSEAGMRAGIAQLIRQLKESDSR